MTSWSSSRSRKAWKTGVIPPSSSGYEPRNIRWFSTRFSSASSVRVQTARSRDLHAEHPLDGHHHAQLVGERRQPVVAVGQHDDLPVVPGLEQLLRAAVHVADDRLGVLDPLAVQHQPQPQHAVRGGVLRADVEHHVGASRLRRSEVVSVTAQYPDRRLRVPDCGVPVRSWRQPGPLTGQLRVRAAPEASPCATDRHGAPGEATPSAAAVRSARPPRRRRGQRPQVAGGVARGQRRAAGARAAHAAAARRASRWVVPGRATALAVAAAAAHASSATCAVRSQLPSGTGRTSRPARKPVERAERRPGPRRRARSPPPPPAPRSSDADRAAPTPRPAAGRSPPGRPASGQRPPARQPRARPRRPPGRRAARRRRRPDQDLAAARPSSSASATSTGTLSSHSLANSSPRDPARRPVASTRSGASSPAGRGGALHRVRPVAGQPSAAAARRARPASSSPRPGTDVDDHRSAPRDGPAPRRPGAAAGRPPRRRAGEACTEVRKWPAGPLGPQVEAAGPVQRALPWPPASPPAGRTSSPVNGRRCTSPPCGVRPPRRRIALPVDPVTACHAALRWVTCSASTTSSADTRRASTPSGPSSCSGSRRCGCVWRDSAGAHGPAWAAARWSVALAWSSRCAAGRRSRCCCWPSPPGSAQLIARRRDQSRRTSRCW